MKPRKLTLPLRLLCAWIFVSPLYYAQTLFSGEFIKDIDEGFAYKFAKYVVCAAISAYLVLRSRNVFTGGIGVLMLLALMAHLMTGGTPNIFAITVLTLTTMVGFSCLLQAHPEATRAIARSIAFSAAVVGCFSVVELTVLADNFLAYWAATGGVRSISTMFNPNNLGIYMGASLLILPWAALSRRATAVLAAPILFGLGASGSRTSWVSVFICLTILFVLPRTGRALRRGVLQYKWVLLVLAAGVIAAIPLFIEIVQVLGVESENRGADLYTASVRLTHFLEYLDLIDDYSLLPDVADERADLIQDSVYLTLFNTFGATGCIVMLMALAGGLRRGPVLPDNGRMAWSLLLGYYLVVGLSASFVNSFPNNQLFFIALGGAFVPRVVAWRSRRRDNTGVPAEPLP